MIDLNSLKYFIVYITMSIGFITSGSPVMSYEEPSYKVIKNAGDYEIREYEPRVAAQITYGDESSGFRQLFSYISGANEGSKKVEMTIPVAQSLKIDMTTPVTQSNNGGQRVMQFFLPRQFTIDTAPKPKDPRVNIIELPTTHFAVMSYSGFATNKNFGVHYNKLKVALKQDGVEIVGSPIKATYNGPFALPFMRRNEAMYQVEWPIN